LPHIQIKLLIDQASDFKKIDDAILAAINSYQAHRKYKSGDRINFILTKWDVHTNGVTNPIFRSPPPKFIEYLIEERYKSSWTVFQNLSGPKNQEKTVMPYSAGIISDRLNLPIPETYQPILSLFPRKLWNWIYVGASNGKSLYKNESYKSKSKFLKYFNFFN
jgi:hypothetical protein